jgi:hypothetical protein
VLSVYHGVSVELPSGVPIALRDSGVFTMGVSEMAVVTADRGRTLSAMARDLSFEA